MERDGERLISVRGDYATSVRLSLGGPAFPEAEMPKSPRIQAELLVTFEQTAADHFAASECERMDLDAVLAQFRPLARVGVPSTLAERRAVVGGGLEGGR